MREASFRYPPKNKTRTAKAIRRLNVPDGFPQKRISPERFYAVAFERDFAVSLP